MNKKSNQGLGRLSGAAMMVLVLGLGGCAEMPLWGKNDTEAAMEQAKKDQRQQAERDAKNFAQSMLNELSPEPAFAVEKPQQKQEKRFDLNAMGLGAPAVYQALVESTPWSLIVDADVRDLISIQLKDVTLDEALDALRDAYGLEYEMKGRRLHISKPKLISKTFQMNYLLGSRSGRSDVRVSSGSISDSGGQAAGAAGQAGSVQSAGSGGVKGMEASRITTSLQNDFWAGMSSSLNSMVGKENGKEVVINPQSGLVFVRAMPSEMREVEAYLKKTERVVGRQVMLEAKIIEVVLTQGAQAGINWAALDGAGKHQFSVGGNLTQIDGATRSLVSGTTLGGGSGLLSASGGGVMNMAFSNGNFAALMSFLETQGDIHVLSTPRVATLNNQKAVLKVGTDEFFVTNVSTTTTTTGTGAGTTTPTINVQPFFSGIALDVTPQIDEAGLVTLHVHPSVSEVSEKAKNINLGALGNYSLPLASSNINEADSMVRVNDGQIVAIGGLMRSASVNSDSKVPGLGDVPAAGSLFKQTSKSARKSELVILIKPTVISAPSDWGRAGQGASSGIQ